MAKRDVLSLALRVLGVVLIVQGIVGIPSVIASAVAIASQQWASGEPVSLLNVLNWVGIIVYVTVGIVLFFGGDAVARRLCSSQERIELPEALDASSIFTTGARIVGLVFALQAIRWLLGGLSKVAASTVQLAGVTESDLPKAFSESLRPEGLASIISALVLLALSAYLVWGAPHLAKLIYRSECEGSA